MRPETTSIAARVREIVSAAGIDNFHIENDILVMCGVRYVVERCGCDDPQCNGIRLQREEDRGGGNFFALQ
ncbi:hypothetical protein GCM10007897_40890 [Sphingobium jiangsuense]|uniref:Uncharacterized protein n=1 Tax=Sphingobium jiangsuense TaxID=870476 RepID=A0A7W6BNI4_9SPHN|nr:hypothetical protein [Sphingobium jiangsuense]MBB3928176.1 hypothetical protein [Sphingobium jiangsuense]GLT02668.1 hypothetical protein GCM10007897_40890 [Sphingobium jiangsuense]